MMRDGRSNSCPFTVSQWQELEHQALIYKYMASGTPIPHDLILPIRSFFYLGPPSTSATQLFLQQPTIGWGCYQMGFGRKAEDPEPGRCRRTDGKKWRCSREAHMDSKYCEKHMHRGKNRSRKPAETPIATNSTVSTATNFTNTSSLYPPRIAMSAAMAAEPQNHTFPFSTAAEHSFMGFTPQVRDHQISRDAAPSSADRDYRYCYSAKEGVNDHASAETIGVDRDGPWRKSGCFTVAEPASQEEDGKRPHCFVLGTDFKMERPAKAEGKEGRQRRPLRYSGGWPPKAEEPWMDDEVEEEEKPRWGPFPGTQLSISIPMAHQPSGNGNSDQ